MRFFLCIGLLWIGLVNAPCVYAQTVPSSADPSRLDEPTLGQAPDLPVQVEPLKPKETTGSIPVAHNGFLLNDVSLEGFHAFTRAELEPILQEYIGKQADLITLNHLARRLSRHYQQNDYFLAKVYIPPQAVENGVVILQAIEGSITRVEIDDPDNVLRKDSFHLTAEFVKQLESMAPVKASVLERSVLLLNEHAGISANVVVDADKTSDKVGAVILTLQIRPKKAEAFVSYDNYGSRFIGVNQLGLDYKIGGVLSAYDTLSLSQKIAVPMSEMSQTSVSHETMLTASGWQLGNTLTYTSSYPGYTLRTLEAESDTTSWETRVRYPLIRSRDQNVWLNSGFYFKNTATELLDQEFIDDKIRKVFVGLSYSQQETTGAYNAAQLSLEHGLDVLNATKAGQGGTSRAQGRSDFAKVIGSASRLQAVPQTDWQVMGRVQGQYSAHPLLSSEEIGFGGASIGRGYNPSEITGDHGLGGQLELRYAGIAPIEGKTAVTPFVFYDVGKVWNLDANTVPQSLASAGGGAYIQMGSSVSASVMLAYPLTRPVETPVMGGDDGPRALVKILSRF